MSIGEQIHKTEPCVLHLSVLPVTTPEQLSEHLWTWIGLNVPVEQISIKSDDSSRNFTALIVLDRVNLADALSRWLASVGAHIVVAPAVNKKERGAGKLRRDAARAQAFQQRQRA